MKTKSKKTVQRIVVGGVVMNKGKVLILQRNKNEDVYPNMWELPSGKKELLEETREALVREMKEETGLNIKVILPFSVFDYIIEKRDETRDSTQINYLVVCSGSNKPVLSHEHQNFAWVSESKLNGFNLTIATKEVIREAFKVAKMIRMQNKL